MLVHDHLHLIKAIADIKEPELNDEVTFFLPFDLRYPTIGVDLKIWNGSVGIKWIAGQLEI